MRNDHNKVFRANSYTAIMELEDISTLKAKLMHLLTQSQPDESIQFDLE
jgi:hypothetical protein